MYNKVETSLNFVEREKQIEKFWKDNDIFGKKERLTPFTTALPQQTASPISAMC